jgi:outer membrane protein assembly factor BamB
VTPSIAVDHVRCLILVGSYDGYLYVLAQDTGRVLHKVPCGGSLYASVVLSSLAVTAHSGYLIGAEGKGSYTGESAERSLGRGQTRRAEESVWGDRSRSILPVGVTAALDGADPEPALPLSVSYDRTCTYTESSIVFACSTVGKLIAFGLPPLQRLPSDSVHLPTPNPQADTLTEAAAVSLMVLWEYDGGAPIFSTPLVTRTQSMTVRTVSHGIAVDEDVVWRRDIVLIGVVDGTVRCLELRSRVHLNSSEPSDLGGVGEELWRVSFASKPVFSSVCCVDRFMAATRQYHGIFGTRCNGGTADGDMVAIIPGIQAISGNPNDLDPSIYSARGINGRLKGDSAEGESAMPPVFPPLADLTVVFGSHDGHLRGVSPQGSLLWETDLGSVIFSSPCSVPLTGLVVAATTAGTVYLVDCDGGTVIREESSGDTVADSIGDAVAVSCEPCETPSRSFVGSVLGSVRLSGEIYSSPVVCGDVIYLGCRDDSVHSLRLMS